MPLAAPVTKTTLLLKSPWLIHLPHRRHINFFHIATNFIVKIPRFGVSITPYFSNTPFAISIG
jgi:hypothetical protein